MTVGSGQSRVSITITSGDGVLGWWKVSWLPNGSGRFRGVARRV